MKDNDCEKLRKELDKIRSDYNRATRLLRNVEVFGVEEFSIKFKEWKSTLLDEKNGIANVWKWVNENSTKIENSKTESKKIVEEIKINLTYVNENIENMQISYEKFLEIKGKIEGAETNIENLSENSKKLKNDIENLKEGSQITLDNIKELFQKAQTQIANMQGAYEDFLEIKGKIDDKDGGLEAIFNDIKNIQKKSQALYKEIQSFRDESNKLLDNIKTNKEESDTLKSRMDNLFVTAKDTTESKIKEIKKITALITDTGFANAFHAQAKKLNNGRIGWGIVFLLSIIGLTILLSKLFIDNSGDTTKLIILGTNEIIYRLSLTSPLLFLIGFSMSQYSREASLNDRYAFKATTASTISHHIEFLQKKFPKDGKEILDFAKNTFTKIYKEPYKTDDDKKITKLEEKIEDLSKDKNSDKKVDIEKIIKSTKELKELFTDESLLKEVIGLFSKIFN